jgi:hypothetical protein
VESVRQRKRQHLISPEPGYTPIAKNLMNTSSEVGKVTYNLGHGEDKEARWIKSMKKFR